MERYRIGRPCTAAFAGASLSSSVRDPSTHRVAHLLRVLDTQWKLEMSIGCCASLVREVGDSM